jgi:hypothetical protein
MLAKLFMKYLLIWLTSMLWLPLVRAQGTKPLSLAELAVYRGADREELLVTGAKKEGKLVWYTALAGGSYKELARAFEAKYGIQVEVYRGASKDLISKVLAEAQAKKFIMDVAESSPPLMMIMRSMRLHPFTFTISPSICPKPRRRPAAAVFTGRRIENPTWALLTTPRRFQLMRCRRTTTGF